MKRIIRHYVIATFSLWSVSQIAQGIIFEEGFKTILLAGLGVTLTSILAKPVINILLLPLNMITFGLFRWLSSAIIFYLVTLILTEFKITGFSYPGLSTEWFDIPAIKLAGIGAYVGFSLLYSVIASFIYWVRK